MSKSKGQHDEDDNDDGEGIVKENGDQCSYAQIFDREISAPACFPQLSVLKTGTTVVDFYTNKCEHHADNSHRT